MIAWCDHLDPDGERPDDISDNERTSPVRLTCQPVLARQKAARVNRSSPSEENPQSDKQCTSPIRLTYAHFKYAEKWYIETWQGVIAWPRRVNGSNHIAVITAYSFQLAYMGR